jgi:hypothetical protein
MPLDSIEVYVEQDDGTRSGGSFPGFFPRIPGVWKEWGSTVGVPKNEAEADYIFWVSRSSPPLAKHEPSFGKEIVGSHHFNRGNFLKY